MPKYGPQTPASQEVFKMKRCQPGEEFRDVCNRVASKLTTNSDEYMKFRQLLLEQKYLPGGRITTSIGSAKHVCSHNCFVSGKIADSFVDGPGSIMQRATEAAATMRMGGGIGYDFSTLRPRGDMVKRLQSNATGPISFMEIFNAVGLTVHSSGHRRGAQMAVLRVDHPDVEEFVHAKQNEHALRGFNISIAVTDEFMRAVERGDSEFPLKFAGQVYRTINPGELWETIMRSAWDWAEPGVLFIDTINNMNNLYYCEEITATNPCAEQPLPAFGACLLGSFNLPKYLVPNHSHSRIADWDFDSLQFSADVATVVRAMDKVIDVATYPLFAQSEEAKDKRRMGLGVTGLANAIEAMGYSYGSQNFIQITHAILMNLRNSAYEASAMLAKELGAFPMFERDKYLNGAFIHQLPSSTRNLIEKYGIRNSHLTSIAPTGTISFCADNVSSSIEPVFAYEEVRWVNTPEGMREFDVQDYGYRVLGVKGKLASDVTAEEHIMVISAAQRYMDSSVSKTCNVDGSMPWAEFKNIYMRAWRLGAKGCTVFNKDGRRMGIRKASESHEKNCTSGTCDV